MSRASRTRAAVTQETVHVFQPILAFVGDVAARSTEFLPSMLAAAPAGGAGHGPAGEGITNLLSLQAFIALVTLTVLEIVLGIDNIIFISVLADKLPVDQQGRARTLGLSLAMILRVLLLLSISWIMSLTAAVPGIGQQLTWAMG